MAQPHNLLSYIAHTLLALDGFIKPLFAAPGSDCDDSVHDVLNDLITVMTCAQMRSDSFLVIRLAKSTSGGRWAGLPVSTRICINMKQINS
jgi:hypothetical protein